MDKNTVVFQIVVEDILNCASEIGAQLNEDEILEVKEQIQSSFEWVQTVTEIIKLVKGE